MSRVIPIKQRSIIRAQGLRIDKVIHQRRRERDLRLKHINYIRSK